jgi:hypothetical protein
VVAKQVDEDGNWVLLKVAPESIHSSERVPRPVGWFLEKADAEFAAEVFAIKAKGLQMAILDPVPRNVPVYPVSDVDVAMGDS